MYRIGRICESLVKVSGCQVASNFDSGKVFYTIKQLINNRAGHWDSKRP